MYRLLSRRLMTTMTTITTRTRPDKWIDVQICPSYPDKPKAVENLMKGLHGLLKTSTGDSSQTENISNRYWDIDSTGDTIHRHIMVNPERAIPGILQQIKTASQELNHDPHTYVHGSHLTISCTTHVPPGLSMKDVKLAKRIDEILGTATSEESTITIDGSADSSEQRALGEKQNMDAIAKAKEQCSCG